MWSGVPPWGPRVPPESTGCTQLNAPPPPTMSGKGEGGRVGVEGTQIQTEQETRQVGNKNEEETLGVGTWWEGHKCQGEVCGGRGIIMLVGKGE